MLVCTNITMHPWFLLTFQTYRENGTPVKQNQKPFAIELMVLSKSDKNAQSAITSSGSTMTGLRDIDRKILFELLRNSKISDRQLGKRLGVSQATVTRRRKMLEKDVIDSYTLVPRWDKIGYDILAINFVKVKPTIASGNEYQAVRDRGLKWLMSQSNIIMTASCRGMGMDAFNISIHKSYSDYDEWFTSFRQTMGDLADEMQSVLVNLKGKEVLKPLNFKYLAESK